MSALWNYSSRSEPSPDFTGRVESMATRLGIEIHKGGIEQHRYLNMELLKEHCKSRLQ